MKASELAKNLQNLIDEFGDLDVVGGELHDDVGPESVVAVDDDGCETSDEGEVVGFYICAY